MSNIKDPSRRIKLMCDAYFLDLAYYDIPDDIQSAITLRNATGKSLRKARRLRKKTSHMIKNDKNLTQKICDIKRNSEEFYEECQRLSHDLDVDQYLERMIETLENYGKSIKLVMYPYQNCPNQISHLRRKFAKLLDGPKYTESDTALTTLYKETSV